MLENALQIVVCNLAALKELCNVHVQHHILLQGLLRWHHLAIGIRNITSWCEVLHLSSTSSRPKLHKKWYISVILLF